MARRLTTPLALLVAMWAALYLPHLLAGQTLPLRDVSATQFAWRAVWQSQLRHGWAPLWDPYSNGGRPLLANPNAMAAYPGTLLFLALTPETAAAWHLALHHLILLLGCYRLARRGGAGPPAAGIAAAATATCGVAWSSLTFLNFQASLTWSVWALAAAVPAPEPGRPALRRALAGGAFLGLAFLGGEPVTAAFGALAWSAVTLWTWRPRPWLAPAAAAVAAALLAAPVLVPLLAIFPETVRGGLAAAQGALGADALAPRRFLELAFPDLLGAPLGDGTSGFWARPSFPWQRYYPLVFLGAIPIVCLPAAFRRRRALAPWWALAAAGTFGALALAPAGVALAAQQVPVLASVRYAIKLLVLPVLALTPLVAAGWEALVAAWSPGGRRRARTVAVAVAALAPFALAPNALLRPLLAALYPASRPGLDRVRPAALARSAAKDWIALAAPPAVAALAGPAPLAVAASTLAAGTLAGSGVLLFDRSERWAAPPAALAVLPAEPVVAVLEPAAPTAELASALERFRFQRDALTPESGTRWGVRYVLSRGPDGLEPMRAELLAAATSHMGLAEKARVARALGADAVVSNAPIPGWRGVRTGAVWISVADTRLPRAYLARRLLPADGMLTAATVMGSESFRPGADAAVFGAGGARDSGGGTVAGPDGPPHRLSLEVAAEAPAMLVVQQSYMACWRATIDGVPAAIEPVNGAATGVRLPGGRHRVELRLDTAPYRIGAAGPLLLLLIAALTRAGGSSRVRSDATRDAGRSSPATPPAP